MVFLGKICQLCWYAYLASIHFLWTSPKLLWHGRELTNWQKHFWGDFRWKGKCLGGVSRIFKESVITTLTTFWALITRLSISSVTCNKNNSKEKTLLYFKPSIPKQMLYLTLPPFFRLGLIYACGHYVCELGESDKPTVITFCTHRTHPAPRNALTFWELGKLQTNTRKLRMNTVPTKLQTSFVFVKKLGCLCPDTDG